MWNTSWCCIAIRSVKWSACKYQVIIDQQVIFISLTSIESSSNKVDTVERSASVSHDENYKREKRLVRTRSFVSFPFFRSTRVRFAVFVRWNGVSRQFRHRQFCRIESFARRGRGYPWRAVGTHGERGVEKWKNALPRGQSRPNESHAMRTVRTVEEQSSCAKPVSL